MARRDDSAFSVSDQATDARGEGGDGQGREQREVSRNPTTRVSPAAAYRHFDSKDALLADTALAERMTANAAVIRGRNGTAKAADLIEALAR